ncbi:MAG: hypothetical protein HOK61_06365 [Alphaproteobacteria bacterium]|jgi:hypothetical protein|nr:hypothetical protein [Alphaproteobacteria bacterium]
MKPVEFEFSPSNSHADLIARDSATVLGWRYGPAIQFDRGEGIFIYDCLTSALMGQASRIA